MFIHAYLAWRHGPGIRHGVGIHSRIHVSCKRAGRAYALRWKRYRDRVLQERDENKLAPTSDSEGEDGAKAAKSKPDLEDDEELLHDFQVALAREIAAYKADEKKPAGLYLISLMDSWFPLVGGGGW